MKQVNAYVLGHKSDKVQTKIKDILKQIKYKSTTDENRIFDFSNYFNWFNEPLEKTIQKIQEIVKESKKNDNFREIIIYSFENYQKHKNEIEILFKSYDSERYFQPFFICIAKNEEELSQIKQGIKEEIKIFFEDEEEEEIYENNFSYLQLNLEEVNKPININSQKMEREIMKKFIRIYSYYNELGDNFFEVLKKQNNILKNQEENKKRINVICLGKSQRGKSSFINLLLKEKRAREGGLGNKCSNKISKYMYDEVPLNVFDTVGISSDKNGEIVNELLLKIEEMQKELKEEILHLVLYFLDYNDMHPFDPKELNIFKQLCKGNIKVYYIFVCIKFGEVNNGKKRSKKIINKLISNHMLKVRNSLKELCLNEYIEIIVPDNEKKKKEKTKKISIIDYLYCCQENLDIHEVDTEKIDVNTKLSKIINIEKSIAYINTIKFIKDGIITEKYGIKNLCSKIIKLLNIIYKENMNNYIKLLKENNKDDSEFKLEMTHLSQILPNEEEEKIPLINEFEINEKKIDDILEVLKEKAHKKALKYKIGSVAVGMIPIPGIDVLIQYFLKKNVMEDIAHIFGDHLTEIKITNNSNQQYEFENDIEVLIEQANKKIDDKKSDITKTTYKAIQIMSDILQVSRPRGKVSFDFLVKTATKIASGLLFAGGMVIGVGFGAYIMVSDIRVIIHLFKERLKFRLSTIKSIGQVIDYLNKLE